MPIISGAQALQLFLFFLCFYLSVFLGPPSVAFPGTLPCHGGDELLSKRTKFTFTFKRLCGMAAYISCGLQLGQHCRLLK